MALALFCIALRSNFALSAMPWRLRSCVSCIISISDAQAAREAHAHASQDRVESFQANQAERESDMEMMHETHDLKRQGMADKAKFDRKAMQNKARANA